MTAIACSREKGLRAIKQGDSPTYRLFSDKFNAGAGGITVSTNRDGHFVVRTVFRIEHFKLNLIAFYFVRAKISGFCYFLVIFLGVCLPGSLQDGIFINSGRLFREKPASDVTNFGQTFSISPRVNSIRTPNACKTDTSRSAME